MKRALLTIAIASLLVTLGLTMGFTLRSCRDPNDCTNSFFAKGTHLECKP